MAHRPSFVPRDLLLNSSGFGQDPDAVWRLATDEPGAVLLHRAREQHELACAITATLQAGKFSIPDLASKLLCRRDGLWRKLTGQVPATENDLIRWTWLTGEPRRSFPLNALTETLIQGPTFPITRRRTR